MASIEAPTAVRFEHHVAGRPVLGIGTSRPRISWQIASAPPDYVQAGYELEITTRGSVDVVQVWSAEQVLVPWPAEPLQPRESAQVRVRVRGVRAGAGDGEWSDWSQTAVVEAGLSAADWSARFVSPRTLGRMDMAAPVVRGVLHIAGEIAQARLYATAHGCYLAHLNGERVGDEQLAPGWASYGKRLEYQTHDVTHLLREGENSLEVLLGNGWFRGRLGFTGGRALYGDRLALLAQLEVTTVDGVVHTLATDPTWTADESEVLADDLYDGQRTDLRRRGDTRTFPDHVDVLDAELSRLVAPDGPPVRVTDLLPAVDVRPTPSGTTLVDFGQNIVGWVRLKVRGQSGQEVTVRHGEVLEHGQLDVRPLRTARATDTYVLAGSGEEVCEPCLTFHGFRYAEVSGVDEISTADVEAVVVGSDLQRIGWFTSSHELLNTFHENVVWSMRGNFLSVPTDCPQRDERLGWTGDIQVFAPSASFLFDTAGFLTSWLEDLAADQQEDGSVPLVVPDVLDQPGLVAAAWSDAATVVPWVIYQRTSDSGLLGRQLRSMSEWVDRAAELAGPDGLWSGGFQLGDWLDPTAPLEAPFAAQTDPDVIATAYLARSAQIVADAAAVLGQDDVSAHYGDLEQAVRRAFADEYVTPSGRVLSDAPTAYALAIEWAMLPTDRQREHAGRCLADLVRTSGFRISTGFVGTPLVFDALIAVGASQVAYRLLLQQGCPSWLYPVTMGATTVWERWDSMLPDGSTNVLGDGLSGDPAGMTSFNHYALGAVTDSLHRVVAGLAPGAPGYRELLVKPQPTPLLTSASARHLTPYGEAAVHWQRRAGELTLEVEVPVGAHATVHVPGVAAPVRVAHGSHGWTVADPCQADATALPPDATIRDLLDHASLWSEVVAASIAAGVVEDDAAAAARVAPYLDRGVDGLAAALALPHEGFASAARAELEERLTVVLDSTDPPSISG